jgi:hypothetical protein
MQNFKFEAAIDLSSAAQVNALKTFVTAVHQDLVISEGRPVEDIRVVDAEVVTPAPKAEAKKARPAAPKKEEPVKEETPAAVAAAVAAAEEAPAQEEPVKEAPSTASTIKIETIRAEVSKKVTNHRDAIKKELTRLGAANVTALPVEKYGEFLDFLNALA